MTVYNPYRNTEFPTFSFLNTLLEELGTPKKGDNYPPYNIVEDADDDYKISIAVAGIPRANLSVSIEDGYLVIKGEKQAATEEKTGKRFVHKGLAQRSFVQRFTLGDTLRVDEVFLQDGILDIGIKKVVPEHKKPKMIPIISE